MAATAQQGLDLVSVQPVYVSAQLHVTVASPGCCEASNLGQIIMVHWALLLVVQAALFAL